ncbi:MAG: gfo/Idh/MocA family oxidoreductase, partial [Verrucomicrobiia bacterium]
MNQSRRTFVKTAVVAGASLPLFNIGRAQTSANNAIRHASFGASGQARRDISNMLSQGVQLVAVADVDASYLAALQERHPDQNFRTYTDWRELLDKEHKNLDTVNVSVPDHMHASIGIEAM